MQPIYSWRSTPIIVILIVVFLGACKDKKEPTKETQQEYNGPVTESLSNGSLDTLYIEREAFDTIKKGSQFLFSFTFKTTDSLTLHGWLLKPGNDFDSLPNIRLKNLRAGGLTYGVGRYFGNVLLTPVKYNKIKDNLTPDMKYVLFAPILKGENIAYEVFVTDKIDHDMKQIRMISPTGVVANPSPPKVE